MTLPLDTPLAELDFHTQAAKTLAAAGIVTVEQLLALTRAQVAALPKMGAARLADLDAVMADHRLTYGRRPLPDSESAGGAPNCATCPRCPGCGNPRSDDRRHVATDWTGRASHLGHRIAPTCDACHDHHRQLFAATA